MVVNRNPEYFLTIVREKSISRAAEKLYISQSSLSQYIAKLESALEVKLFDRSKNPIQLTEAGRLYQSYLESNNHLYQKLQSDLNDLISDRSQSLSIGLGTWRGSLLIPEILPDFLQRHPGARVSLHEFPVSELAALTLNEAVDFAVMNTAVTGTPDALVQEVIAHERILLVMNRNLPSTQAFLEQQPAGGPADLHLLRGQRLITLSRSLIVGRHVSNFLERNLLSFPDQILTTNNSTTLSLVERGLGFCFMVETGLSDLRDRPELAALDLQSQDLMIPLSLLYKKNSYLSPLVREAMELIRSYYLRLIRSNHPLPSPAQI